MRVAERSFGQLYPPGTFTPGTTPSGSTAANVKLGAIFRFVDPATKMALKDLKVHVRIEPTPDAPRAGGETGNYTTDRFGMIEPSIMSSQTSNTYYVSLTPSGVSEAIVWRKPFTFVQKPVSPYTIINQPGGGLDIPAPTEEEPPAAVTSRTDWATILGIGVLVLGAGFLVYQIAFKKRVGRRTALPVPQEA